MESLFFPVLWKSYSHIPLAFKVGILWGFPVPLLDPQAGKPAVGFRTFTTVGELLWYYCSPVCGSPTLQVRDLILSQLYPSYHLTAASSLSFYLFWGGGAGGFTDSSIGKESPAMQETLVQFLGWKEPLEKGTATHSSILVWRILWTV